MPDTTNRAWLVNLLADSRDLFDDPADQADVIIDSGWRPPLRVIRTVEELDALPGGALIVIDDSSIQKDKRDQCWWWNGNEVEEVSEDIVRHLPGLLVWTPGDTDA